jgi:hypothetical protein
MGEVPPELKPENFSRGKTQMSSSVIQDCHPITLKQKPGLQSKTSVIVHISERDVMNLMLETLKDWASWAAGDITCKLVGIKDGKSRIDEDELERDTELLSHLNYVIKVFGGEEQKLSEEAGEPSCGPC